MKIKTSITLDENLLRAIDQHTHEFKSRSNFIERAAHNMLDQIERDAIARQDSEIINRKAATLNQEAHDTLAFQEVS